ncbi:MAG: hypothetical protein QXT53_04775 [Ignisphaera sp.]
MIDFPWLLVGIVVTIVGLVTIGVGYLVRNSTVACLGLYIASAGLFMMSGIAGFVIKSISTAISVSVASSLGGTLLWNLFGSNCNVLSLPPAGR